MAAEAKSPDRIEKQVVLPYPRVRVWRAIATADEFGRWFGARLSGEFLPGATARGALAAPGYEHLTLELQVDRVEPERFFSFHWHPYAVDPSVDYSQEPRTLVSFTLEEAADGTRLTIVESGFEDVPAQRRAEAYRMNDQGWTEQARRIGAYLDTTP